MTHDQLIAQLKQEHLIDSAPPERVDRVSALIQDHVRHVQNEGFHQQQAANLAAQAGHIPAPATNQINPTVAQATAKPTTSTATATAAKPTTPALTQDLQAIEGIVADIADVLDGSAPAATTTTTEGQSAKG